MGGRRPVAPLEGIEQVREVLGVDADTIVGDRDGQASSGPYECCCVDGDPSPSGVYFAALPIRVSQSTLLQTGRVMPRT